MPLHLSYYCANFSELFHHLLCFVIQFKFMKFRHAYSNFNRYGHFTNVEITPFDCICDIDDNTCYIGPSAASRSRPDTCPIAQCVTSLCICYTQRQSMQLPESTQRDSMATHNLGSDRHHPLSHPQSHSRHHCPPLAPHTG